MIFCDSPAVLQADKKVRSTSRKMPIGPMQANKFLMLESTGWMPAE